MGRSVSYPSGTVEIAYRDVSEFDYDDFQFWLDDIRYTSQSLWQSFEPCDEWLDREDHAILKNGLCYLGVSEYCGLASIWLVPRDYIFDAHGFEIDATPFAENFIKRIAPKFHKTFGEFRKVGSFSNGEGVFERIPSR